MSREETINALQQRITDGVAELVTSDDWARMLDASARFHRYSWRNQMLIMVQRPDASRVAGFRTWNRVNRYVRKGEKGIGILTPRSGPCWRCEGGGRVEGVTCSKCDGTGRFGYFKVGYVFDVSQTDGEPLPDVGSSDPTGEAPAGLWAELARQIETAGYRIERAELPDALGRTHYDERLVMIRTSLEPAMAAKVLAHELAHITAGHAARREECQGAREVEAESVAYIVAAAYGMDVDGSSFPYVARWSDGDRELIRNTAGRVAETARTILDAADVADGDAPELAAA